MKPDRIPSRSGRRDPRQNHYPEVDLAEYDRGIASRHHATIQRDGDFYTLVDLGSTNGTMINGVLVPPGAEPPAAQADARSVAARTPIRGRRRARGTWERDVVMGVLLSW